MVINLEYYHTSQIFLNLAESQEVVTSSIEYHHKATIGLYYQGDVVICIRENIFSEDIFTYR